VRIPIGVGTGGGIAVNPLTGRVYVADCCSNPGSISVIDERTNEMMAAVPIGGLGPGTIAVDELRNLIYTCNGNPGAGVSIING